MILLCYISHSILLLTMSKSIQSLCKGCFMYSAEFKTAIKHTYFVIFKNLYLRFKYENNTRRVASPFPLLLKSLKFSSTCSQTVRLDGVKHCSDLFLQLGYSFGLFLFTFYFTYSHKKKFQNKNLKKCIFTHECVMCFLGWRSDWSTFL